MLNRRPTPDRPPIESSARGFSLIELLVVMVVGAVLAAIALPSFEHQLQRMRRSDALIAALQIQTAQERYRSQAPGYASLAQLGTGTRSAGGHYRLDLNLLDVDRYELIATATGLQARDASCRVLKLSSTGLQVVQASGPDPQVANDAAQNRRCWELR